MKLDAKNLFLGSERRSEYKVFTNQKNDNMKHSDLTDSVDVCILKKTDSKYALMAKP